ncbi:MAG: hypothetical protein RLZZ387_2814 [Chloroflexota bacterium]|jgi:uncharacterized membrane protein
MARTVVGLFDRHEQVDRAIRELQANGVRRDDIGVIAADARGEFANRVGGETKIDEGAGAGALSGGVLGGVLGLLMGVGALAIPGIGPVIAAGPLAAALGSAGAGALVGATTGVAAGGLLGALVGAGIPEEEAHVYAEGVRRGSTLLTVATDNVSSTTVESILRTNGAVDINTRGAEWRQQGWRRFDPDAEPYRGNRTIM